MNAPGSRRRGRRSFLARLAGNTALAFAGNAVQRGITFVITLVLARGLGEERFGLYSYVISYMFLFGFLADLGVERVVTRELARHPQKAGEILGSAIAVKLGLALFALIASISAAFALGMGREAWICVAIASLGFPMTIEQIFRGYFQSRFQVGYAFAATLPSTLWFLVVAVVVTRFDLPLYWLFGLGLLSAPFVVGALFWIVFFRLELVLSVRRTLVRSLLRDSVELGGVVFLFLLTMRLDQLLLHHLRGNTEVALYAVGVRLAEALSIVPEAVLITVFPLLVGSEHTAPERFRETYRLGFKYLAAMVIPIALGLTILRTQVVALLFGAAYAGAAAPMAILAWNMCFGFVGVIYLSLFLAQARQRLMFVVSAVALLVNIVLNLAWIPAWGATGSAVATLVANGAGFACWLALPQTRIYMATCLRQAWPGVAAGAVVALLVQVLHLEAGGAVVLLALLYPVALWLFGGLTWGDLALVRRLFAEEKTAA